MYSSARTAEKISCDKGQQLSIIQFYTPGLAMKRNFKFWAENTLVCRVTLHMMM